jgi:hypothetical protein
MSRTILAALMRDGRNRTIACKGRIAQTLEHLLEAGPKGVTALEMQTWALRLSHYIWVLRHRYGVEIATRFEEHGGEFPGKHARYTLLERVQLVDGDQHPGAA